MLTSAQIESNLKNQDLESLYLFYGEEIYLLENCVKKIKAKFGDLVKGINFIEIDETSLHSLISEMETPPFGYEKKLIIVKNANIMCRAH